MQTTCRASKPRARWVSFEQQQQQAISTNSDKAVRQGFCTYKPNRIYANAPMQACQLPTRHSLRLPNLHNRPLSSKHTSPMVPAQHHTTAAAPAKPGMCHYKDSSAPDTAPAGPISQERSGQLQQLERQLQQMQQQQEQALPVQFRGRAVVVGAGPAGEVAACSLSDASLIGYVCLQACACMCSCAAHA